MTESDESNLPPDPSVSEHSTPNAPYNTLSKPAAHESGVIPIPKLSSSRPAQSFDDVFARANAKLAQKKAPEAHEDPFAKAAAVLGKGKAGGSTASSGDARYLVSKDGLDFGPYTKEQVIAQLHNDEIDENTMILDRKTQDRVPMRSISVFTKAIRDYIPVREERRRLQAEQREALVATAKTAGTGVVIAGVVAALLIGAAFMGWWYFIRAQPMPLEQEVLFTDLSAQFKMVPPPKEFDKVSVDNDLLAAIFSEEDPAAKAGRGGRGGRGKRMGKGRAGGRRGGRAGMGRSGESDENISRLDLTNDGGPSTNHILTSSDINATIRSNMGGIRGCILQERKRNPSFKGVSVQFFVRPSGTTGGVKIVEGPFASGPLARCMKPRFQAMRFPRHSGLNKGVVFPFYLR